MVRLIGLSLVLLLSAASALAQSHVVEQRALQDHKAVFGVVSSVDRTLARARLGGTVRNLGIDEGSAVRAGQILATIVDRKLRLKLAALDARRTSLLAQRKLTRTVLDRTKELRKKGALSRARLDEAQTDHDVVVAELAALTAERAVLVQQEREGDIRAPAGGRVLQVAVTEGSVVQPGEVIAVIAADRYILRIRIPERHARYIKAGDPVRIAERGLATAPRTPRQGTIAKVYPEIEGGRVTADVSVEGMGDYFVGERTRVWVATGTRNAVVIPTGYLINRFGLTYARLKSGVEVVVQTGGGVDGGIEILSGLETGDTLVRP